MKNSTAFIGTPRRRNAASFPIVRTTESKAFLMSIRTRWRSFPYRMASSIRLTMPTADRVVRRSDRKACCHRCNRWASSSLDLSRDFTILTTPFIVTSSSFSGLSLSTRFTPGIFSIATITALFHWGGTRPKCMELL